MAAKNTLMVGGSCYRAAMLSFSRDPQVAERQMQAVIFYLTTFGYIDGDFDDSERAFVSDYIRKLVESRVVGAMPEASEEVRGELVARFTTHFHEVFENIDAHVRELFTEAVAKDEDQDAFVHAKLKLRCFELFQGFDRDSQEVLLTAMDELIAADGVVHPAEQKFRNELVALFEDDLGVELVDESRHGRATIADGSREVGTKNHPFFNQFEHHYSPEKIRVQIEADRKLLARVRELWAEQREKGKGRLAGHQDVTDFAGEDAFLDEHIYVHPPTAPAGYELTVLGDLHGCYCCLKGAVMQADFFEKVARYRKAPENNPKPLIVFLGDYIDRGMFSLNGVLRTVLQMFVTAPEHVYVLRGNHEYYVEYQGQIYGGVRPAEAINTLKPHLPIDVFRDYMELFEQMPSALIFDRTLFVHAGIPRDLLIKEIWQDLSSLNHADVRFQMMWSDPSSADVIPAALQEQSARFPFGRLQAAAFLQRLGCNTLIRGHEKVKSGFATNYDDDTVTLLTLFSAGGKDNGDLPANSSYRNVTPKALTLRWDHGEVALESWAIDYATYNDPEHNAFFRMPASIDHRAG